MTQAGTTKANRGTEVGIGTPKQGDAFRSAKCGMALQITADCKCTESDHVHYHCCGQEMNKV